MQEVMGPASAAQPVYRNTADASAASIDDRALAPLACDVSFATEYTTPPEVLVARQVERLKDPRFTALWWDILDRIRGSSVIAHPAGVMTLVRQALHEAKVALNDNWTDALFRFFDQINQVHF